MDRFAGLKPASRPPARPRLRFNRYAHPADNLNNDSPL